MASLQERIIGAMRLDSNTFEEVERDETAMGQAMLVVIAAGIAAAIGAIGRGGLRFMFVLLFAAIAGWFIWAFLTFIIGTKLMPEKQTQADFGQMLRVLGFSAAPGLLNILGFIPFFGWIIGLVAGLWQLAAMVVAVRQGLDFSSTGRAIVVCIIGWFVYMIFSVMMATMFGGIAMMGRGFGV